MRGKIKIFMNINREKMKQLYQCSICKIWYKEKEWAKKCKAWCKEHKSCNLEITRYAIKLNKNLWRKQF